MNLDTGIEYLKGVGPQRADLLKKEARIFTFRDLLYYFPFRYVDKTAYYKIAEIHADMQHIQFVGEIVHVEIVGKVRAQRMVALLKDDTGTIELIWFKGIRFLKNTVKRGARFIVFGKPSSFNGKINIAHPELERYSPNKIQAGSKMQPVYPSTEKLGVFGLNSKGIEKLTEILLKTVLNIIPETLPDYLIEQFKLITAKEAYRQVHLPQNEELLSKAKFRLKFEELFYIQLQILRSKLSRMQEVEGFVFETIGDAFNSFYKDVLPFDLTGAQKRVIKEVRSDLKKGKQMNRLLQGDVGSGKTIVATLVMLIGVDNGFQSALMAPTEILATQHFEGIKAQLNQIGLRVELLTGSTKKAARKEIHEALLAGEIHVLVGTHALLEDKVKFKNLGLVVIDEQHRFGVAQRSRMYEKNHIAPHILVMSATPIPRTLAMTLYGDLEVSIIDELPPGRKPIKTVHKKDSGRLRVFGFMREEIKKGRQIYIVYPLIEESEKLDLKNIEDGYESIKRAFPDNQVSIVHGRMKADVKDYEMQRFVKGETQIMVATTVIEVGVNVPNASVMVIENAERFGLAQLHQLRGRVGRGAEQSYCVLMTKDKLSEDGKIRMETMVGTNDGFEVSEADLRLRGPGDLMGTQQSGVLNLLVADLAKDGEILKVARHAAMDVLRSDPNFKKPEHEVIRRHFIRFIKDRPNWSSVS